MSRFEPCGIVEEGRACGGKHRAHGLCSKHYQRYLKHGEPKPPGKKEIVDYCTVCQKRAWGKGLCNKHYQRKYVLGYDILDDGPDGRPLYGPTRYPKPPYSNADGYIVYPSNIKAAPIREHRIVMAGIIGRELTSIENVHHINGDRTDNRPENLELWSESQPAGQRVTDKLAWAREIIEIYGPLEHVLQ